MNGPDHLDEFTPVRNIIDRERDEALGFFRKTDFESCLNLRLMADRKTEKAALFLFRKPVLVLSALALVCCGAAIVIFQILSPSPHEKSVRIIEEFLFKNTNLQEVLAEEIGTENKQELMTVSFEQELECWQNPDCRKKIFTQIMNVFKEVRNDTEDISL